MTLHDNQVERLAVHHEDFGFGRVDAYGLSSHGFSGKGLRRFVRDLTKLLQAEPSVVEAELNAMCLAQAEQRTDDQAEAYRWCVPSKDGATSLVFYLAAEARREDVEAFLIREHPDFDPSQLQQKVCLAPNPVLLPLERLVPKKGVSND